MNIAQFCIDRKIVTIVLTVVLLAGGALSFQGMSRLEDPEFTIKDALIVTPYPGATAREVEEEVTDEIEQAVQQLGQLKRVQSQSIAGLSTVTVTIKDAYGKDALPQVWDEVRRKVSDAQGRLPPGAGASLVVDDYGDVFGVFIAIYGNEYSYAELKEFVDFLKRELLLVQDVAKVEVFGERTEAIFIEFSRDRMAELGIPKSAIIDELQKRNIVTNSGRVEVGTEFLRITPTGAVNAEVDFGSILISRGREQQVYLRDVANIRRGYVEPQSNVLRYDGNEAIGLGISTISGGNVVVMGQALKKRFDELTPLVPLGIEFGIISLQSDSVVASINNFTLSLVEAVVIVIIVLLIFMGLRSGLIIGFVLLLTITGSFIFLDAMSVALERISLGALIIALGMLVDNAIVIVDGVLVRLEKGEKPEKAATGAVSQAAIPLLAATLIAILAFAAIGTSQDNTGEFCRSLFQVVMVSLLLSWVTAVTVTPLLCVMFLKQPEAGAEPRDPYAGAFYSGYRAFLTRAIRQRGVTLGIVLLVFGTAIWGFGFVEQSFFPPSTRPQIMVDFWLPQSTHIDETTASASEIEEYLIEQDGVTHVSSLVGQGGLRFLLTYKPEKNNSSYVQFLVDVESTDKVDGLVPTVENYLAEQYTDAVSYVSRFELGPGSNGKIRARFSGPDANELRRLANRTVEIFDSHPNAKGVRTDWRQRVKVVQPVVADVQANLNGITRPDVSLVFQEAFEGARIGVYREGDLLLPIIIRSEVEQRSDIQNISNLQIWSPASESMIPIRQIISGFETVFEDDIIMRRDRKSTITIFADPIEGPATVLFEHLRPQVEAIPLGEGYKLEWGGEYEDSNNAQAGIAASLPFFILVMVLITISLFNSLRQALVIWLCVPLALIGVTAGLLVTQQPFGFMATLGFLSLIGMLIKNAIVLVDQMNIEVSEGKNLYDSIVDSGVSRLRPVAMAALTTALGMIPLLFDAFFVSMAVTIIAGLLFATVLTMIFLPVLYSVVYRVQGPEFASAQTQPAS